MTQETQETEAKVYSKEIFLKAVLDYLSAICGDYFDNSRDCVDYHGLKEKKAKIIELFRLAPKEDHFELRYYVLNNLTPNANDSRLVSSLVKFAHELDNSLL